MSGPAPSLQYAWDGPGTNGAGQDGQALLWNQATGKFVMGAAGVTAHSGLTGLTSGDDHTQYQHMSLTAIGGRNAVNVTGAVGGTNCYLHHVQWTSPPGTGTNTIVLASVRGDALAPTGLCVSDYGGNPFLIAGNLSGSGISQWWRGTGTQFYSWGTNFASIDFVGAFFSVGGASYIPLYLKGYAGQTANLTEWRNSSGTVLTSVDAGGSIKAIGTAYNRKALYFGSTGGTSIGLYGTDNYMYVDAGGSTVAMFGFAAGGFSQKNLSVAAGNVGLIILGHASQTANLLEAQTSAAAVQFAIGAAGKILTNQAATNTNTPSGATAKAMPIYDAAGTLLGYMPVYASQW